MVSLHSAKPNANHGQRLSLYFSSMEQRSSIRTGGKQLSCRYWCGQNGGYPWNRCKWWGNKDKKMGVPKGI